MWKSRVLKLFFGVVIILFTFSCGVKSPEKAIELAEKTIETDSLMLIRSAIYLDSLSTDSSYSGFSFGATIYLIGKSWKIGRDEVRIDYFTENFQYKLYRTIGTQRIFSPLIYYHGCFYKFDFKDYRTEELWWYSIVMLDECSIECISEKSGYKLYPKGNIPVGVGWLYHIKSKYYLFSPLKEGNKLLIPEILPCAYGNEKGK